MADRAFDESLMHQALALGRRGLGQTGTNPAVGAILVRDGQIVGRGWTQAGGRPHAEVEALRRAGAAAKGATLYVTLEPCSHHGRSPPCADAVIAAGVARVVSAMEDPNPLVAGQGHARLRAAGIAVECGLGAKEAARDHAGHIRRVRDGRVHVILKLAVSADGSIGAAGGRPVAITGEAARQRSHLLRAQCDAILVGIGTVLADDPALTCRLPGMAARSPHRVVLDASLRLPPGSALARSARTVPVLVYAGEGQAPSAALAEAGVEIAAVPFANGHADLPAVLRDLSVRGHTRLLVEGGAQVAAAFAQAGLVDEFWLFQSPVVVGAGGVPALAGLPLETLTRAPHDAPRPVQSFGPDRLTIFDRIG